jgi:hypothetical protein
VRLLFLSLLAAGAVAQVQPKTPGWIGDRPHLCEQLALHTNGGKATALRRPKSIHFDQFKARPIVKPRGDEATIDKDAAFDDRLFEKEVKSEAVRGPDFAGRYAIVLWTCGSWCANATIADVRTGKTFDVPFLGVVGCKKVTGEHRTIERKADSRLLVVRGSLEIPEGDYFYEGPCGTFYYLWQQPHLRLIGCELSDE